MTCCDSRKSNFRDLKYIDLYRNKLTQKEMLKNQNNIKGSHEGTEMENDFPAKRARIEDTSVNSSYSESEQEQEKRLSEKGARSSNDESGQEQRKVRNNRNTRIKSITLDSSDGESEKDQRTVRRKRNFKKDSSVDILDSGSERERERSLRKRTAKKRSVYKESSNDESERENEKVVRNRAARKKIKYQESSNEESEIEGKRNTRIKRLDIDSESEKEQRNVTKKRDARIKSMSVDNSDVEGEQERGLKEHNSSTKNRNQDSSNDEKQPHKRKLVIKINAGVKSRFVDSSDGESELNQQKMVNKRERKKETSVDSSDYESEKEHEKMAKMKSARTKIVSDEGSTDESDHKHKVLHKKRNVTKKTISVSGSDVDSEQEQLLTKEVLKKSKVNANHSNSDSEQEQKNVKAKRINNDGSRHKIENEKKKEMNKADAVCIDLSDDEEDVEVVPTRSGRTRGRNINYSEKSLAAAYAESDSDEKDSDESFSYKDDSDDDDFDEKEENGRKRGKKNSKEEKKEKKKETDSDESSEEAYSDDDVWEEEDVKRERRKTSKEDRKTEKKAKKKAKPVSEYEEMRQKNVEDKLAFLKSLQMDEVMADFNECFEDKRPKKPHIKKKLDEFAIERKSKRLENVTMNLSEKDMAEKVYKTLVVPEEKPERVYLPRNYAFEEAIQEGDYENYVNKYDDFFKNMETVITITDTKNKRKKKVVSNEDNNHVPLDFLNQSSYKTAQLSFHSSTLDFHPFADKTILMASSKLGHVSFWDSATDFNPVAFKPHTDRVTHVKAHPQNPYNIISSSWDGTIRKADLETKIFSLPYRDDVVCKYFDFTSPTDILVAQKSGIITHVDFRLKGSDARHFKCHNASIRTISVHPTNRFCCVTVDNQGLLKIWDTRYQASYTPVISVPTKAAEAAFFSPVTGNSILCPSQKFMRIYASSKMKQQGLEELKMLPVRKLIKCCTSIQKSQVSTLASSYNTASWLPNSDNTFTFLNNFWGNISVLDGLGKEINTLKLEEAGLFHAVHTSLNVMAVITEASASIKKQQPSIVKIYSKRSSR